ncbi:tRNA N6-adenosine threonylcarbamoyltransferase [uncultured Defluviicoccus sp.]|uniref:N(6)-L-threonylcarbamoyladenine synthase n=1 Tax=metagenome TaxID=256318 RepID=A0A380T8R3_9ZZZZ|nr:tRNA N6-adenosine threonylcarbamoyltransferase [uncultured Defluviicoccus sp.]SUS07434.1 tRNA N6-adenosine threonylcarbamoyltransferase [uncultured Defluviicoccus sp.]
MTTVGERPLRVLGIETSCDETAAAVVTGDRQIHADCVRSQREQHQAFGGVVPEVAARAHLQYLDSLISQAMTDAGVAFADLDGIAAAAGPGLIGGVIVGMMTAKAIALAAGKPFLAVNHLEAHALTARLTDDLPFPYLLLLASGGHCQLLVVAGVGSYRRLGTTIDDALGEAFDKVARMLGLGYPGGPPVEACARNGDPRRFPLPRPMKGRPGCDFSFSGLKTAVKHLVDGLQQADRPLSEQDIADVCASFQAAAGEAVADRAAHAIAAFRHIVPAGGALVIAGGVAANKDLRARLARLAEETDIRMVAPPLRLCTDNGAMIAWAGIERLRLGLTDALDFRPRPRWPLDPEAPPAAFAGVKA